MVAGDAALQSEIVGLRTDMVAGAAALQSEIAALRTDMIAGDAALGNDIYRMEARLVKWTVGAIIAMSVITSSLMTIIITIFRLLD